MTTTIKDINGERQFITQQYAWGLYLAIYHEGKTVPEQATLDIDEEKFHLSLRKSAKKFRVELIIEKSDIIKRNKKIRIKKET